MATISHNGVEPSAAGSAAEAEAEAEAAGGEAEAPARELTQEELMAQMMGFGGFGTTKGKP